MLPDFIKSFSDFFQVAKYLPPLPWDADVVKAYANRKLALNLETGNDYTLAMMQTIRVLFGEEIESSLNEWSHDKSSIIIEPIKKHYNNIEKQLQSVMEKQFKMERRIKLRSLLFSSLALTSILSIFAIVFISPLNRKFFYDIFLKTDMYILLPIIALGGIVGIFFDYIPKLFFKSEKSIAKANLERQRKMLEERLNKLDLLKQADFQTLIKKSKEI
jgi:hypothetical protein